MSTRYLTGVTNDRVEVFAKTWSVGLLIQPGNSYDKRIERFDFWAADNGCFASKWDQAGWWTWLSLAARRAREVGALETCLFAVAPDVVGDAEGTLEKSAPWLERIRALGLPVAFVAQDGSELDVDRLIPWGQFDVLFLGGSTEFKLDPKRAGLVTAEARRRGVPVHMGRVNSKKRMVLAASWDCATADGTFLAFGGRDQLRRLRTWLEAVLPDAPARARAWAFVEASDQWDQLWASAERKRAARAANRAARKAAAA